MQGCCLAGQAPPSTSIERPSPSQVDDDKSHILHSLYCLSLLLAFNNCADKTITGLRYSHPFITIYSS